VRKRRERAYSVSTRAFLEPSQDMGTLFIFFECTCLPPFYHPSHTDFISQ